MRLLIILTALLSMLVAPCVADTITVRADAWCPYNCKPDDKKQGYGIDIIKTIFEKAGHTIDYSNLNWADSIARTRKGEFTAIIGATNSDAPDFVFPNEPIGMSSITYAVREDDPSILHSVSDLKAKKLGVIDAYSYNPVVDAYIAKHKSDAQKIHIETGEDALEKNISLLLDHKLDAVCDDTNVIYYKTNKMSVFNKLKMSQDTGNLTHIYLAFSPSNPKAKEYAALLDKGIAELRSSGKLKAILQKYGLSDWK